MARIKQGLGSGIERLIPTGLEENGPEAITLKLSQIEPNRKQPRKKFDEEGLASLSESMKKYGVIQPIVVCKQGDYYEIVAGERRWRAAQRAGLKEIPVVICEYSEQERMEISLIENLQRQNLNPIEEARGYESLMEKYSLTQEELSERVFRSRAAVANTLRLLKLPEDIQDLLINGKLSGGHARALLALSSKGDQMHIADKIIEDDLSVRQTESLVNKINRKKKNEKEKSGVVNDANYEKLERDMSEFLGMKVSIKQKANGAGRLEISYSSSDELSRIYEMIRKFQG